MIGINGLKSITRRGKAMDKIDELETTGMYRLINFLKKRTSESAEINENEIDEFQEIISKYNRKYADYKRLYVEFEICQTELKRSKDESSKLYDSLCNKIKDKIEKEKWDECGIPISILDVI